MASQPRVFGQAIKSLGSVTAADGLAASGPLSSGSYAVQIGAAGVAPDIGFRCYASKSATNLFLDVHSVAAMLWSATATISYFDFFANGAFTASAAFVASGSVAFAQVTSPSLLTASQNDWAPTTPIQTNIRLQANAGLSITGILAGTGGQEITLFNIGSNAVTLTHSSASSASANRILCPGSANLSLRANGAITLWYDNTTIMWRAIAP